MNKKEAEIIDWEFEELLRNIVSAYLKLRKFERFQTWLDTHEEVKEIYDITITKRNCGAKMKMGGEKDDT